MGKDHGGSGGDMPPDGDRTPDPELPELPPGWAHVEIPDDLSALADEAEQIRQELAEERRTGRRPGQAEPGPTSTQPSGGLTGTSVGTPLLIMSIAVMITLVSLFAMAWSGSGVNGRGGGQLPASGQVTLPPITLTDSVGRQVALTHQAPMVILLVEECECQSLVAATASAAPRGVRVVVIGHGVPPPPPGLAPDAPVPVRLADPGGMVRRQLELGVPTDAATVVLVNSETQITRTYQAATSVAQFQGELADLAPR